MIARNKKDLSLQELTNAALEGRHRAAMEPLHLVSSAQSPAALLQDGPSLRQQIVVYVAHSVWVQGVGGVGALEPHDDVRTQCQRQC